MLNLYNTFLLFRSQSLSLFNRNHTANQLFLKKWEVYVQSALVWIYVQFHFVVGLILAGFSCDNKKYGYFLQIILKGSNAPFWIICKSGIENRANCKNSLWEKRRCQIVAHPDYTTHYTLQLSFNQDHSMGGGGVTLCPWCFLALKCLHQLIFVITGAILIVVFCFPRVEMLSLNQMKEAERQNSSQKSTMLLTSDVAV